MRSNDCRIGMRALMILQSLKIQMNLILLPLRKMSSQGIQPCRQVWQSSSLVDNFMRQLQSGMSSSSQMKESKFQGLGQISLCLNLLGLVKTLIFLLRMISQMSNLHTLLIYISTIMIFNLRALLPFSQSCLMIALRKGYSWDYLHFYQKRSNVLPMTQVASESEIRLSFLSYLRLGSYLKRAFTSFITRYYIFYELPKQADSEQSRGKRGSSNDWLTWVDLLYTGKDMQGSRIEGRSNWKQAMKKDNPIQSRIFGENKDLPNKFSPSRLNNVQGSSRSLIRHRTSNYSHDEINIAALLDPQERSISKQGKLQRKETLKTPKSLKGDSQIPIKPAMMSEKSIDFEINRLASKPSNFKSGDIDIVRELKLQFMRFKEKILKELKRQEEEFTRTLRIINERISSLQNCTESPIQFKSSPSALKANSILSPQLQGYQSPISKYLQALNKQMPVNSQTSSYKNLKIDQILSQDSVTPQIKERMSRMDELLSTLKRDLNEQLPMSQHQPIVTNTDI